MSYEDDDDTSTTNSIAPRREEHLNFMASYRQHGQQQPVGPSEDTLRQRAETVDEELNRLRSTVATLRSGTLEARYFEQVKRNRELTVHLNSEKDRVRKLQQSILAMETERQEESKLQRKGVLMPSQTLAGRGGGAAADKPAPSDSTEAMVDLLSKELEQTKLRLERSGKVNANLKYQLEQRKAASTKLRQILVAEIGNEVEVEKLLKAAGVLSTSAQPSGDVDAEAIDSPTRSVVGGGSTVSATAQGGSGWKGRAQQIALLKMKVKDLQRLVSEQAVHRLADGADELGARGAVGSAFEEGGSTIGGCGPLPTDISGTADGRPLDEGDLQSLLRAINRERHQPRGGVTSTAAGSIAGMSPTTKLGTASVGSRYGGGGAGAPSVAGGSSVQRDFDDVNRDRLDVMEKKKLQEVRELANRLRVKEEESNKEKQRADSLQARLVILERDCQHLKACLSRMVEKAQNDDKLIAAYKTSMEQLEQRVRSKDHAEDSGNGALAGGAKSSVAASAAARDARCAAENARLIDTVADLRQQLSAATRRRAHEDSRLRTAAAAADSDDEDGGQDVLLSRGRRPETNLTDLDDVDLLKSALRAKGAVLDDDSSLLGMAIGIIDRQRSALLALESHVQRRESATPSSAKAGNPADAAAAAHALPARSVETMRSENASLKERIATLSELMDREIFLYKSLASAAAVTAPPDDVRNPISSHHRQTRGPSNQAVKPSSFIDDADPSEAAEQDEAAAANGWVPRSAREYHPPTPAQDPTRESNHRGSAFVVRQVVSAPAHTTQVGTAKSAVRQQQSNVVAGPSAHRHPVTSVKESSSGLSLPPIGSASLPTTERVPGVMYRRSADDAAHHGRNVAAIGIDDDDEDDEHNRIEPRDLERAYDQLDRMRRPSSSSTQRSAASSSVAQPPSVEKPDSRPQQKVPKKVTASRVVR